MGEADGKAATSLSRFGVAAFTVDNDGRLTAGDLFRRRPLIVDASGNTKVLRDQAGGQIPYNPITSLSALRRPAISRANSAITTYSVAGLDGIARNESGGMFPPYSNFPLASLAPR